MMFKSRFHAGIRDGSIAANEDIKAKSLGLTISLEVGYKLSAKGESYLAARE